MKTPCSPEISCVPFQSQCCGAKTKFKKIDDSVYKPWYDRMHERIQNNLEYAKRISKIRSKTVEPVLGTLINFTSMRRVNTRGMKAANKHVLMGALTYNLKKLLKFSRLKPKTNAAEMAQSLREAVFSCLKTFPGLQTLDLWTADFQPPQTSLNQRPT